MKPERQKKNGTADAPLLYSPSIIGRRGDGDQAFLPFKLHRFISGAVGIEVRTSGFTDYGFGPGHGYGLRDYWRKRGESKKAGRSAR
jgi:hypothetical protein